MLFDDCRELEDSSIDIWKKVTSEHVKSEMEKAVVKEKGIYDLTVEIYFTDQFVPIPIGAANETSTTESDEMKEPIGDKESRKGPKPEHRFLQTNKSPLGILFDVMFSLRSPIYEHDYPAYFRNTLNNKKERVDYIIRLQESGDSSFNGINTVSVEMAGREIFEPDPIVNQVEVEQPVNVSLFAGIAAGVVLAALLIIGFVFLRKKRHLESTTYHNGGDGKKVYDDNEMYVEVENKNDDISTLGDPVGNWSAQSGRFDDPTVGER